MGDSSSSLELALADVEIIRSAYPDETIDESDTAAATTSLCFPLHVTLRLSDSAELALEWTEGYPHSTNVQVAKYRSRKEHLRLERAVEAVRRTAQDCLEDGVEGGLACCAAAMEAWNAYKEEEEKQQQQQPDADLDDQTVRDNIHQQTQPTKHYDWMTGEPLIDRKSTFQAHVCQVHSELDVKLALDQLMDGNTKIHRATHNMYAYRFTEETDSGSGAAAGILKHDNDDDGEDGAGARLSHLLQMKQTDGLLVVVSRWYGGIHLGPKRFAHITNVARELLEAYEEKRKPTP